MQGRPLNSLLTIAWRKTPRFRKAEWSTLQTEVTDKLTRFLRRRSIGTAFTWTRERVTGIGAHTHIALHLGKRPRKIAAELLRYLERAFSFDPKYVDISMGEDGANSATMRSGILRYIAKGLDHKCAGERAPPHAAGRGTRGHGGQVPEQEGAVVLVSMAASAAADIPRGVGFLFNHERLNIAAGIPAQGRWAAGGAGARLPIKALAQVTGARLRGRSASPIRSCDAWSW